MDKKTENGRSDGYMVIINDPDSSIRVDGYLKRELYCMIWIGSNTGSISGSVMYGTYVCVVIYQWIQLAGNEGIHQTRGANVIDTLTEH